MVTLNSNQLRQRTTLVCCTLVAVSLAASVGCRNNGQQPFGGPNYGFNTNAFNTNGVPNPAALTGGNPRGNSPTIAAPGTYSINIPGGRGVNPYANGAIGSIGANGARVGQLPSGLINTRQPAPTPTGGPNSPANFNQREGWRSGNGTDLNTQSNTANQAPVTQVATALRDRSTTGFNNTRQGAASTVPQLRPTGNLASLATANVATTRSPDYRTTLTDERQDSTRLPVTDASNMRPIAQIAQANIPRPANQQPYYQPRQSNPANYQGTFAQPPNSAYQGSFQNAGGSFNAPAAQSQLVRTQSTATYDPYNSTAGDWRNRSRDSQSY